MQLSICRVPDGALAVEPVCSPFTARSLGAAYNTRLLGGSSEEIFKGLQKD